MVDNEGLETVFEDTDLWQHDSVRFVVLAILGTAASYLSVNIPHTDVFIEGRWIFGFMGFVVLRRWWMALLLACVLSLVRPSGMSLWMIFAGNMLYALPALIFIRFLHQRVLDHLRSVFLYGLTWFLMILGGYQILAPVLWGLLALWDGQPFWPAVLIGIQVQPFFIESLLVGIISALAMMVIRSNTDLRTSKREIEQILETVPEGVVLLDVEGHILQANPMAQKYLTVLVETDVDDILKHIGDQALAELLTPPTTKGLWHEIKVKERTFEALARPVEYGSASELWVLVLSDVTHEREIRAQLQRQERLAAVGQLAAGIAHDFNNIMATIILYLRLIERAEGLSDRDRERLATVNKQAWHASRLIEQILDFSRKAVLERQALDVLPLLKEHVKLLERTLPENIKIALVYESGEYVVNADATRIQQILTNLAVNARDAMPDGGALCIELTKITLTPETVVHLPETALQHSQNIKAGEWICLTVSDTGTGIAPDVLPHIFEPFFTTKEPGRGSGLGLAQVFGIVRHHEGHIDVTTEVGAGTTFTVYLPALATQQPERQTLEDPTVVQGQGEVILVVEDDASLRTALVESVELLNYRVLEAADGHEALGILEQHQGTISLVLSDLVMPKMGGSALLKTMRSRSITIPVVILSGHPMESEIDSLRAQGLAGWLLKPPDMEQLAQLLARALEQ